MGWMRHNRCLGLAIDAGRLTATLLRPGAGNRVAWSHSTERAEDGAPEDFSGLGAFAVELRQRLGRVAVPAQVAVPDPLVRTVIFELDDVPKSRQMRRNLIALWLGRRFPHEQGEFVYTGQYLGRDGDRHLLLGAGMARSHYAAIRQALSEAGLVPSVIDAAGAFRHNHVHVRLRPNSVWLTVEPGYWSLSLMDGEGRPRYLRSAWRTGTAGSVEEPEAIADEVERTMRGFLGADQSREIACIHLTASSAELERLESRFLERIGGPVERLTGPGGTEPPPPYLSDSMTSLAVAVTR